MALGDDIKESFEKLKNSLNAEQARRAVSRDLMPFEYANGRVMFGPDKTREIIRDYTIHDNVGTAITRVSDEMLNIPELSALSVGYVRNRDLKYIFIFVRLQD